MKRIRSLDLLKFIMAILIVFHHYQQNTGMRGSAVNFYEGTIYWGSLVELFFIISGYLSAVGMERIEEQNFREFILNKAIRIYPMAMLSVLFTTAAGFLYVVVYKEWYGGVRLTLWKLWNSLLLTVSGGAVSDGLGINWPLWYLCVLLYCYVIMYFIIWFCNRRGLNRIYGFILMSLIGLSVLQYDIKLPFFNEYSGRGYAAFFLGMLLFYIWSTVSHKILVTYSVVALIVSMAIYFGAYSLFAANMRDVMTYIIFPPVLFLTLAMDGIFKPKVIDKAELGGIAYDIYLWHNCGICVWMIAGRMTEMIDLDDYGMMFVFTGILVMVTVFLYHFIEKKLTHYLRKKIN